MVIERGSEEELSSNPNNGILSKAVKRAGKDLANVRKAKAMEKTGKNPEKVCKPAVLSFFWTQVRKFEARVLKATFL